MPELQLLSRDTEKLGFQNIKNTLILIQKSKLDLSFELNTEISSLLKSVDNILDNSTEGKRVKFSKIKGINNPVIVCENINIVLDTIGSKLKGINLEEKEEKLKELNELIKGGSLDDFKEGKEEYGDEIKTLNEEIQNIKLLQKIVDEIEGYRKILKEIIDKKEEITPKKEKIKREKKPINIKPEYKKTKPVNDKIKPVINNEEEQYNLKIKNFNELYEGENFIESIRKGWDSLDENQKLEICYFLMSQKDKETLNLFFKASEYNLNRLSEGNSEKLNKIIDYISNKPKKGTKETKLIKSKIVEKPIETKISETPKKVVEIKSKTPEEKFEFETGYELSEKCFTELEPEQQVFFIDVLINSDIKDITVYTFITDFITSEESDEIISYDFLYENQKRLGIKVEEKEPEEKIVENSVIEKVRETNSKEKTAKLTYKTNTGAGVRDIRETGIKAVTGSRGKTKQVRPYEKTHNIGRKIIGKEGEKLKIETSLDHHFSIFKKRDNISDTFIKYINSKKESNLFVEMLSKKIIKLTNTFITIFFTELEKLALNKDFYSKMFIFTFNIETENIENKLLFLNLLDKKRDPNFELSEEFFEEKENKDDKDDIINLLSKKRISITDYIVIFKGYNKPEFLLERYKKHNTTNIINATKFNDETKIEYFKVFREAFVRNFNKFENSNEVRNCIRSLDRNLIKLGVEQSISDMETILAEFEELNNKPKTISIQSIKEEEIKLLPYFPTSIPEENKSEIIQDKNLSNTKPKAEKNNSSFGLDFLNSDSNLEGIMNFLRTFREQISTEEGFFKLLEEVNNNPEQQERLFDLLLVEKSENERNFISFLAYNIGKISEENSGDNTEEISAYISELEKESSKLNEIIKEKDKIILEAQKEKDSLIEVLKNKDLEFKRTQIFVEELKEYNGKSEEYEQIEEVEKSLKPEEVIKKNKEELSKEQSIILQNLGNKGKRKNDDKTWYDIGIEKLSKLGKIDSSFTKNLIIKLKADDLTRLYNDEFFNKTNDVKIQIFGKLNSETILLGDNKNLYLKLSVDVLKGNITNNDRKIILNKIAKIKTAK